MRYILLKLREALADIAHESRAAGAGEEAALGKLRSLIVRDHVRAERRFEHVAEAESLDGRDDLAGLCIGELADDRRGDYRVNAVAVLEHLYRVENEGLIRQCAERALVNTRAAGDALAVVDLDGAVLVHGYRADLAGVLAGALAVVYSGVWADGGALAAVDALALVNVRVVELIVRYRAARAGVLAAVRDAAAAGLRHGVAPGRAVVAGDVERFNDVRVVPVPARGELDALS